MRCYRILTQYVLSNVLTVILFPTASWQEPFCPLPPCSAIARHQSSLSPSMTDGTLWETNSRLNCSEARSLLRQSTDRTTHTHLQWLPIRYVWCSLPYAFTWLGHLADLLSSWHLTCYFPYVHFQQCESLSSPLSFATHKHSMADLRITQSHDLLAGHLTAIHKHAKFI